MSHKEEKVIKSLLVFGQLRGDDSTGIGSVTRSVIEDEHEVKLAKEIGTPNYLFETKRFNTVFQGNNCVFIGHNRSRTVGENTRNNAHPFKFENVLGAHNGTIDYQNKARLEQGHLFKTDSEAIFNNIEAHGIEDTIGRIESTEAYALTWYDKRDHTVNLLRNDKRPLIYCTVNDGKTLFWASEYGMLMAAIYREGLKPDDKAIDLPVDFVFTWSVPEFAKDKIGLPSRKKFDNYKWSKKNTTYGQTTTSETGAANTVGFNVSTRLYGDEPPLGQEPPKPGMIWGGHFVGWIDSKNSSDLSVVDSAIAKVRRVFGPTERQTPGPRIPIGRGMTADDILRRKAYERLEQADSAPTESITVRKYLDHTNIKVWRDLHNGMWTTAKYNCQRDEWDLYITKIAPDELPFTILDIEARHCFKHKGKKKKKETFYRGFNGALLNRERFEKCMVEGCAQCSRKPEWGNEIVFFDKDHEFLCEWCSLEPGLIEAMLACSGHKKKAA